MQIYKADKSTALAITESNKQASAKAQSLPARVIAEIALPESTNFYILYDSILTAVASADKFGIKIGKTVNKINGVSLVEKVNTPTFEKALANYEYIIGETGVTAEDLLGYAVELDLEDKLAVDSEVTLTTQEGAVTSISSLTSPAETKSTKVISDSTSPILEAITIQTSSTAQSIVLLFNKKIVTVDKGKILVQDENNKYLVDEAETNEKTVLLSFTSVLPKGANIMVTLLAQAVQDQAGNFNAEDNKGKVGIVGTNVPDDRSGPTITAVSANDGENTKVVVTFSETVTVVDETKFKVQVAQGVGTASAATTSYGDATAPKSAKVETGADGQVTLTLESAFAEGNTIEVTLEAGAVQDSEKNNNEILTTASEESRTVVSDGTGPTITGVSANSGANTTVIVAFSEALGTTIDASKFKVQVNGGTAVAPRSAVSGTDAHKITLTLATAFVAGNTIKVSLEAGAVQDSEKNNNKVDSEGSSATVLDSTKPIITAVSANDKENKKVVVAFSEAVIIVELQKFKVQVAGRTAITPSNAELGTGDDGHKVTLTLGTAFEVGNIIKVSLEANAVQDSASKSKNNEAIEATTIVGDTTGPKITGIRGNDGDASIVAVSFNEVVRVLDARKFKVQVGTGDGNTSEASKEYATAKAIQKDNATIHTIGALTESHIVHIRLSAAFAVGNIIKVTLDAGAVEDTASPTANENIEDSTGSETTIRDGTGPTITGLSANDGANTQIIVSFNEALESTIDASKFKVQVNDGLVVAAKSAVVGTGDDSNKVTLTVATAFAAGNTIKVTLEKNAVQDEVQE